MPPRARSRRSTSPADGTVGAELGLPPDRLALFDESRDALLTIRRDGVARDRLGHHSICLHLWRFDLLVETLFADAQGVAAELRELVDQRHHFRIKRIERHGAVDQSPRLGRS